MTIGIDTKDCTALSDTELAEMADMCTDSPSRYEVGLLSKQVEAWVLITLARDGSRLRGFSFSTLERIGGTPSVLMAMGSVKRGAKRESVLRAIVADQFRRAVLAFPDEDVLIGSRFCDPGAVVALKGLDSQVPLPGHEPSGEDRAWGRRLAKRFGVDADCYRDRAFVIEGDDSFPCVLDHAALKPEKIDPEVVAVFDVIDTDRGDALIAFGWAMAEDLARLA